jgi:NCAIR mutase (PurE)-related protein
MVGLALAGEEPVIVTRLEPERLAQVAAMADWEQWPPATEHPRYLTLVAQPLAARGDGHVGILAAGSSDRVVAMEAAAVLRAVGVRHEVVLDCGVSAIERTRIALTEQAHADVLIVVAGFEAALATVVTSMVPQPVVGVPTSVGYGAARGGETALFAMLASCAQGLVVVGIDNGFAAGCAAVRLLVGARRSR